MNSSMNPRRGFASWITGAAVSVLATTTFVAPAAAQCGNPAAGDCCSANGTPFCSDSECCTQICAADPFCCNTQWDQICADAATASCAVCNGGGGCEFEVCGTGGDCFEVHPDPGCNDSACCCAVCEFNAFCCEVEWDAGCVDEANALCGGGGGGCGDPGTGDCCSANGTPFCEDEACCTQICAIDPFCCETSWDGLCADQAANLCESCGAVPCPTKCDGTEVSEDEPCGEDTDGGCNSEPPLFRDLGVVEIGDSVAVCGNAWAADNTRDTDWYSFTLTELSEVTWAVKGDGPFVAFLVTGSCPPSVLEVGTGSCPVSVTKCLPPGEYVAFTAMSVFGGFACPGVDYVATLSIASPENCPAGPPNDFCANAIPVEEGETPFDNTNAFTDGPVLPANCASFGSSQIFNDIWFTYTATCTDEITVSTCDTASFDTRLAIYTGECTSLSLVACNDDGSGCGGFTSRVKFDATAGTTYVIRLGAFGATQFGSGTMLVCGCNVECPAAPGCGSPDAGPCGQANSTPGCDNVECCEFICEIDPFCCATMWDQICANQANALCFAEPCKAGQNCPPVSVPEGEPCGEDVNGGCNMPGGADGTTALEVGDTVCSTFWAANNVRDTDWYQFTITEDSDVTWAVNSDIEVVAFIISATCPPTIIGTDDAGTCPTVVATCLPPGTYRAFAAMPFFNGIACGGTLNNYTATLTASATDQCGLDNDQCSGAIAIQTGDTSFSNVGSFSDGDPLPSQCISFGSAIIYNDIWFKWVADTNGNATVSTCNQASFDTRLAAYIGTCDNLTLVGCNDDATGCAGFTSKMELDVTLGVTYYIRVGSFGATTQGTGVLTIGEGGSGGPENDNCNGAYELLDGVTPVNNFNATNSGVLLPSACTSFGSVTIYNDVWFLYDATCSGTITMSMCPAEGGSGTFDTRLAVWSGGCSSLAIVACNDDSCGLQSKVTFQATCGETYLVQLGAYGTTGFGSGNLFVGCAGGEPCGNETPGDLNGDGVVNGLDLTLLLAAWGSNNPVADINQDGIVNALDLNILLANWSF